MKTAAPTQPPARDFAAALGRLDDYVRGSMDEALAAEYEDELFELALAGAAPELGFRQGLGATFREMSARGTTNVWITGAEVERLKASNLRVLLWDFDPAKPTLPEVPEGADLVITRIAVDLRGVRRVDADIVAPDGTLLKTMPDVTFDPVDGAVYACCEADLARAAGSVATITRVYAVEETGRRLMMEF